MKNLLKMTIILFMGLIVISCEDDDDNTNNTTEGNYYPLSIGDYRVYERYDIDSTNNQTFAGYDSTVVSGTDNKGGKSCFVFTNYTAEENGEYSSIGTNNYYYSENDAVYVWSDLFARYTSINFEGINLTLPFDFGQIWYKIVDTKSSTNASWEIFNQNLTNEEIEIQDGITGNFTGNLTIKATNKGIKNVTLGTKTYSSSHHTNEIKITGTVTVFGLPAQLNVTMNINNYYSDKIGNIQTIQDPVNTNLLTYKLFLKGENSTILRHNVK